MLRDVMSELGLSTYPEVALVLFFLAFLGILAYVAFRRRGAWDRARRLPLDDTRPQAANAPERTDNEEPEDRSDG